MKPSRRSRFESPRSGGYITLIRSEDSIEVTIPMSGMLFNDRLKFTDTSSNQVIARREYWEFLFRQ
jgi:hypothetical protein